MEVQQGMVSESAERRSPTPGELCFTTTTTNATLIIRDRCGKDIVLSDQLWCILSWLINSSNNSISGADNQDGARYYGIGYAGVNKGTGQLIGVLLSWYQVYVINM